MTNAFISVLVGLACLAAGHVHAQQTSTRVHLKPLQISCKNHYILDLPCSPQWNPASGGLTDPDVRVVAVDPVVPTTLYAGGPSGVFKSVDGGDSWHMTGLDMATRAAIDTAGAADRFGNLGFVAASVVTSLAIGFPDEDTLYAATNWKNGCWYGQHRLFKSTDGGATWTDNPAPSINGCDNIHSLALAPSDPQTLYLADFDDSTGDTWSPMVRTTDAAASWVYLGFPVINVLAVDPQDSRIVYGGTFDYAPYGTDLPNGVLKSMDGGATWAATGLTGFGITALATVPGSRGTVYAAGGSHLYKSGDGGTTWAQLDNGAIGLPVTAIAVDPGDPSKVYVGTRGDGVSRTTDAGSTWTAINDGLADLMVQSLAIAGGTNTIYAATPSGVFKLSD